MGVWQVRTNKESEHEQLALQHNVIIAGWQAMPDLSNVSSREEMIAMCRKIYPTTPKMTIANWARQLWAFKEGITENDVVLMPLRKDRAFAAGIVTGPYTYTRGLSDSSVHIRPVRWLTQSLPRSSFDPDILASLGSIVTVCKIQRNQAEDRIRHVLGLNQ